MRILFLHNKYQQAGGEDTVVSAEMGLLRSHGHEVDLLGADNSKIIGFVRKARASVEAIYSPVAKRRVAGRIAEFRPTVVHVHNFFPLLSPSIYYACQEAGVRVVQTLHNYRLVCPGAALFRAGGPCEECLGRGFAWPGIVHSCYRNSRLGTASVASMEGAHRQIGTWRNRVDVFISLSEFAKRKLIEGGLPETKITVKPNFVSDLGVGSDGRGDFALFVGRLSEEKGIDLLLEAWKQARVPMPLKIVGDGPLAQRVRDSAGHCGTEWLAHVPGDRVRQLMSQAAFLILPSLCYENLPMTLVEAFATGLPVIATGHGSMKSLVEHGRTGLHFRQADAEDLAAKIQWAATNRDEMDRMRRGARLEYLEKYTPERNYEILMAIYNHITGGKSIESWTGR